METLVWLFFILSVLVSAYISHKLTAFYYRRKLRRATAANNNSKNNNT